MLGVGSGDAGAGEEVVCLITECLPADAPKGSQCAEALVGDEGGIDAGGQQVNPAGGQDELLALVFRGGFLVALEPEQEGFGDGVTVVWIEGREAVVLVDEPQLIRNAPPQGVAFVGLGDGGCQPVLGTRRTAEPGKGGADGYGAQGIHIADPIGQDAVQIVPGGGAGAGGGAAALGCLFFGDE